MQIEQVSLDRIIPYARNAKKHPREQLDKIAQQISAVGFLVPIIVDKKFVIIAGHGRFAAAQLLNLQTVPVIVADHLSEEEAMAFRIADNKVAESEWDLPILTFELGTLDRADFNLSLTGLPQIEIDKMLKDLAEIDTDKPSAPPAEDKKEEAPPPPRISHVKRGDLWHLGKHVLLCGDATDMTDIDFLLGNAQPSMLFTDPPYGISAVQPNGMIGGHANSKGKVSLPVMGDESTATAKAVYELVKKLNIPKQIIWGGNYFTDFLPPSSCWLVWDKQRGEEKTFADGEIAWTNFDSPLKFIRHQWDGFIKESERGEERAHPTQKPAFLAEWALKQYGEGSEIVLDLFGGSGSTLIGAEKTGHKCFIMELENIYCDVILERFARATGVDPIRADGVAWSHLKSGAV